MPGVRDSWKRRVHEIKTQKNYCLWGKVDLKVVKWNECFKEKAWSKFEREAKVKRNRALKIVAEILKCEKRNRELIKYWEN